MNDTALSEAVKTQLGAVRDCLSTVSSAITASEIIARAHRRRMRRRWTILAGGAGITLGAAAAVTALALGGATSTRPVPAQLTAWTVSEHVGGNIYVHIRELHDPAGLQRTLRADGVPASVTFVGQQNPSCRSYPAGLALINRVFPVQQGAPPGVIVIRPSALPAGTGVYLDAGFSQQPPPGGQQPRSSQPPGTTRRPGSARIVIGVGLVQASPQCTGS